MTLLVMEAIKVATALDDGNNRRRLADELTEELTAESDDENRLNL